jgi:hypothetical protein
VKVVFRNEGTFAAVGAAEDWCATYGLSVGSMERGMPRGIMFGKYTISKWRNLNRSERESLHGTMTGDMRNGPVIVAVDEHAVRKAGGLLPAEPVVAKEPK